MDGGGNCITLSMGGGFLGANAALVTFDFFDAGAIDGNSEECDSAE